MVGDPDPQLTEELTRSGGSVEAVTGVRDLAVAGSSERLVKAALERFGRLDSAIAFTGQIVIGRFLHSTVDDLRKAVTGCLESPYNFLRAVVPVMVDQGGGQVLVLPAPPGPGRRRGHPSILRLGPLPTCWSVTSPARSPVTACR